MHPRCCCRAAVRVITKLVHGLHGGGKSYHLSSLPRLWEYCSWGQMVSYHLSMRSSNGFVTLNTDENQRIYKLFSVVQTINTFNSCAQEYEKKEGDVKATSTCLPSFIISGNAVIHSLWAVALG